MVCPARMRALRCSICQAVMPLTTTVSASAAPIPSGTGTTSAASTSTWLAQPPTLTSAATRVPARPGSTPSPVVRTVPTRS